MSTAETELSKEKQVQILKLRATGYSYNAIAKAVGLDVSQVIAFLDQYYDKRLDPKSLDKELMEATDAYREIERQFDLIVAGFLDLLEDRSLESKSLPPGEREKKLRAVYERRKQLQFALEALKEKAEMTKERISLIKTVMERQEKRLVKVKEEKKGKKLSAGQVTLA